jgi:hypothetical protein
MPRATAFQPAGLAGMEPTSIWSVASAGIISEALLNETISKSMPSCAK